MIRIRDLAKKLDVSIGTVSRALNDKADVNPLTRLRVREAADRLGYSPNQSGRSLRRGRTDLVGITVPTGPGERLIDAVFNAVLDGLRRRLAASGYDLAIFLQGRDEDPFVALKRIAERGIVDALVISDTRTHDPRIDYLVEKRRAFVAFGRSRSGGAHPWVDPDFEAAADLAVDRLSRAGHRRIALVSPDEPTHFLRLTRDGFARAMRRRDFAVAPDDVAVVGRPNAGEASPVDKWFDGPDGPTALVVTGLTHVADLYARLAQRGMKPGRDVSLIAILPESSAVPLNPTLASVETDWSAIGGRLGEALLGSLAQGPLRPRAAKTPIQEVFPVLYRDGESVGAPPRR